jgi:hypothetical protein
MQLTLVKRLSGYYNIKAKVNVNNANINNYLSFLYHECVIYEWEIIFSCWWNI